jgi:hypothetical protein
MRSTEMRVITMRTKKMAIVVRTTMVAKMATAMTTMRMKILTMKMKSKTQA